MSEGKRYLQCAVCADEIHAPSSIAAYGRCRTCGKLLRTFPQGPWKTPPAFPTAPTGPTRLFLTEVLERCAALTDTDRPLLRVAAFEVSVVAGFECW